VPSGLSGTKTYEEGEVMLKGALGAVIMGVIMAAFVCVILELMARG
jgi:hypothetical protein